MTCFGSILFERAECGPKRERAEQSDVFTDLNLDQVIASVTAGKEDYDLTPLFREPLETASAIYYRHEVLRDLDGTPLLGCVESFAEKMRDVRNHLAQASTLRHKHQQERWLLDAADIYCSAVRALAEEFAAAEPRSRALLAFRGHLASYADSADFTSLAEETEVVRSALADVKYKLRISASRIVVARHDNESDYSTEITQTFEKFRRGEVKDYRVKFNARPEMNHVEAGVLDRVALLYPGVFGALDAFCRRRRDFVDAALVRFDREAQFYVSYLRFLQGLRSAGLRFCYPKVSAQAKATRVRDTFDLALAAKLVAERSPVVLNDVELNGRERVIVVSGPNQGGKTTFARMFGQLHYLARLGLPVPGREAELFLCDAVFTHFAREERVQDLSGQLKSDLVRMRAILDAATSNSVIVMNEIFSSTSLHDAISLGARVLQKIITLDALCVCVTFIDELASLGETVVSMVSTVASHNPAERTFNVVRRRADGLSYALAIAARHGVTSDQLKERLAR